MIEKKLIHGIGWISIANACIMEFAFDQLLRIAMLLLFVVGFHKKNTREKTMMGNPTSQNTHAASNTPKPVESDADRNGGSTVHYCRMQSIQGREMKTGFSREIRVFRLSTFNPSLICKACLLYGKPFQ
jgi:hypothetical protein